MYGVNFLTCFVTSFILFLAVIEFWKSVSIWQGYCQKQSATFYGTQCRFLLTTATSLCGQKPWMKVRRFSRYVASIKSHLLPVATWSYNDIKKLPRKANHSYSFVYRTHDWSLRGPVCSRPLPTTLMISGENVCIALWKLTVVTLNIF